MFRKENFIACGLLCLLVLTPGRFLYGIDSEPVIIKRIIGKSISVPRYVSITDNRIDTCSNTRQAMEFIYDLGKDRTLNRLSWFFPKNRYSSAVDYDIYAVDDSSYEHGQKIDLSQWTQIVSRRKNIMRLGRRESFNTISARYILFKSIRSTNKKNRSSFEEFSVGYISPQKAQDLKASYADRKITLQWSSLKDVDGYRIYRSDSAQGKGFIITTSGVLKQNQYVDTDIIPGKDYFYYVTALKSDWQGEKSNVASVRTDHFTPIAPGWQAGISERSTGRYGRNRLSEAKTDYVDNVIGLTVLPDKKRNPQLIYTTLRSPKAKELTPAHLHQGIVKNLYINEKLNLGGIVPCASVNQWPKVDAAKANWVTRTVGFDYQKNVSMTLYQTLTFPGVVMDLSCQSISLFRQSQVGTPKLFAYQSAQGTTVVSKKHGNILTSEMTEPWLIAWWETV
ncbi:MAG: hypothetical protein JKX85_07475, partial [Phycisphaeraceae bacterium]|nr:hypothetical protein [Phycisphaeraceae bacterium]